MTLNSRCGAACIGFLTDRNCNFRGVGGAVVPCGPKLTLSPPQTAVTKFESIAIFCRGL